MAVAKPTSKPNWTVGNPNFGTVTVEPTVGKKITGWTPGEAPPAQFLNWLFYNVSDWINFFEDQVETHKNQIAQIISSLFSTNMVQEELMGLVDGVNDAFTTTQIPSAPSNIFVFVNDMLVPRSGYTLVMKTITFSADFIPQPGQSVQAMFVIHTGFSGQQTQTGGSQPSLGFSRPTTVYHTITEQDVLNKHIVLPQTPFVPESTLLDEMGGTCQMFGTDFTVAGNVLSWSGLGLEAQVQVGDVYRIYYLY